MIYFLIFAMLFMPSLKDISNNQTKECSTIERKIVALKRYVYHTIKPDYERGHPTERLDSLERIERGVGWCDQAVQVFMDLAEKQGIKTRMLFLIKDQSSPHTICEAWEGRWVMIDPSSPLEIYYNGKLATKKEIENDEYLHLYKLPAMVIKKQ